MKNKQTNRQTDKQTDRQIYNAEQIYIYRDLVAFCQEIKARKSIYVFIKEIVAILQKYNAFFIVYCIPHPQRLGTRLLLVRNIEKGS